MAKYAMAIDMDRCIVCHACEVACRSHYDVPVPHYRNWVIELEPQGVYPDIRKTAYIGLCNHCDDAPCTKACPTEATYKREDGIVVVDQDLCIGCGLCIEACPYGARYFNPEIEKVDKCDFCVDRIYDGLEPACVQTCIGNARIFGDLEDPNSEISKLVAKGAKPIVSEEVNVGPNIYYKDERNLFPIVEAAFPPKEPVMPTPQKWWSKVFRPLFWLAIGGTFLGQAAAFALQLYAGESDVKE
jgi:tetrathionate reductase subunit B